MWRKPPTVASLASSSAYTRRKSNLFNPATNRGCPTHGGRVADDMGGRARTLESQAQYAAPSAGECFRTPQPHTNFQKRNRCNQRSNANKCAMHGWAAHPILFNPPPIGVR